MPAAMRVRRHTGHLSQHSLMASLCGKPDGQPLLDSRRL